MSVDRINSSTKKYAIFFFALVTFHIVGTWSVPLIDRDEPRFAEASREMIERGDYIVPHFNNQLRLDKPPLAYWAQCASYKIFGENDFAARFPSAIAAALVAISILAWGGQIGGERVGWWAAIIFTLSLQTFVHAKAAVADMWLVLFMTVAHWAGWERLFRERRTPNVEWSAGDARHGRQNDEGRSERARAASEFQRRTSNWAWWLIFYVSLALGFLAKGPIAWTPLLTVAATRFVLRKTPGRYGISKTVGAGVSPAGKELQPGTAAATEENRVQIGNVDLSQRFKFVRGILLMLAIVALWGVPALIQTHGEFLRIGIGRHVIGRSFSAMESHGSNSLGIYLLLLPFYFVTIFASFFPWSIKLPSLTKKLWRERGRLADGPYFDVYLLCGVGIIFVIFTLIKTKLPHYTLPALPLLSLLLARNWPVFVGAAQKLDGFKPSSFQFVAGAVACVYIALAVFAAPFAERFFPAAQLYRQSRNYLQPEMEFGAVDFQEPSLVWYFRSEVKGWMTPLNQKNAAGFMEKAGARFLILPSALVTQLFPNPPSNWKTFSTSGFNVAKGKRTDLTLLLKPE